MKEARHQECQEAPQMLLPGGPRPKGFKEAPLQKVVDDEVPPPPPEFPQGGGTHQRRFEGHQGVHSQESEHQAVEQHDYTHHAVDHACLQVQSWERFGPSIPRKTGQILVPLCIGQHARCSANAVDDKEHQGVKSRPQGQVRASCSSATQPLHLAILEQNLGCVAEVCRKSKAVGCRPFGTSSQDKLNPAKKTKNRMVAQDKCCEAGPHRVCRQRGKRKTCSDHRHRNNQAGFAGRPR
mmetsp:Transcript_36434/g.85365  ORF Transcript_36434/g.85365 Transcript_36434/m.85365 type:complete len:238 (-) Transcript_36434:170-883(-)